MAEITDYFTSYFGWAAKTPPQLKELLSSQQIIELESLRKESNIPQENFPMCIYMSIQLGRRIIRRDYDLQKKLWPNKPEKDILRHLLIDDLSKHAELTGTATQKELEQVVALADEAMKKIGTLNQLKDYIGSLERQSNPEYYSSTLAGRIDEIISIYKISHCPKCHQRLRIQEDQVDLELKCPKCKHSFYWEDNKRKASDDVQVTRVGPVGVPNPKNGIIGWIFVIAGGLIGIMLFAYLQESYFKTQHVSPIFPLLAMSVGAWLGWWLYEQLKK